MNGWVFAFLGLVLVAHIPVMAAQSALLFYAMVIFSVAVAMLAALNLQIPADQAIAPWPTISAIAGWMIGFAGLLMSYMGVAAVMFAAYGRPVLPVPAPSGFMRATVAGAA